MNETKYHVWALLPDKGPKAPAGLVPSRDEMAPVEHAGGKPVRQHPAGGRPGRVLVGKRPYAAAGL